MLNVLVLVLILVSVLDKLHIVLRIYKKENDLLSMN